MNLSCKIRVLSLLLALALCAVAIPLALPTAAEGEDAPSEDDIYRIGVVWGDDAPAEIALDAPGGLVLGVNTKATGEFARIAAFSAGRYIVAREGEGLAFRNERGVTLYRYGAGGAVALAAKPVPAKDGSAVLLYDGNRYEGTFEFRAQGSGVALISMLPLGRYVACVMSREIYGSWEVEAQKVFAVAARTYAVSHKGLHDKAYGFDLCANTHCQMYRGIDLITDNIAAGAAATAGEILSYNGEPANINYSAISGGVSVKSSEAWGGTDYPYLDAAPTPWERCDYGRYTSKGRWSVSFTPNELYERLRGRFPALAGDIASVRIDRFGTNTAYVTSLTVTDVYGNTVAIERSDNIRIALGLNSACFVVGQAGETVLRPVYELDCFPRSLAGSTPPEGEPLPDVLHAKVVSYNERVTLSGEEGAFVFDGLGWGHGVGLSQYGAWDMVRYGYDYRTVLAYYFRGTTLTQIGGVLAPHSGLGDINRDGYLNALDRTYLARFLAGWSGYEADPDRADLNRDGFVDVLDRTFLARTIAGWEGYEIE